MSLVEVIQWQAQYAIAEGNTISINRRTSAKIEKAETEKILNS